MLDKNELRLSITGAPTYDFSPISTEAELRDAIANIDWKEQERFGAEFESLTVGMPDAKATLVRIALDPTEPMHLHSHAMCALSKIGDRGAVETLVAIISNPKFGDAVHYRAAQWIACIQSHDAVLALERILFDPEASLPAKRGAVYGMDCWSHEADATRVLNRVRGDEELFPMVEDCFDHSLLRSWTSD